MNTKSATDGPMGVEILKVREVNDDLYQFERIKIGLEPIELVQIARALTVMALNHGVTEEQVATAMLGPAGDVVPIEPQLFFEGDDNAS